MNILALNAGSSTLKYKLFRMDANSEPAEQVLTEGTLDHETGGRIVHAAEHVIAECAAHGVDAIGHRVVHGGPVFTEPTRVTPEVMAGLHSLRDLDPIHNPTETAMIEAGLRRLPNVPAVAVFDTAFHRTLPETAWRYALPRDLCDRLHLRRYGFHGISHQYVSGRLIQSLGRSPEGTRLVVCHLGSGASVCAVRDGRSVDTSMGMTPLEGLVMGTRSGDVDPGLLLYLRRATKMTTEAVDDLLNHRSGLLGLSGRSDDVRELESAALGGDECSELALEVFAIRVCKYIGAYAVALEGLDAIAYTGGIGEHSSAMRSRICRRLEFLGLRLDKARNDSPGSDAVRISVDGAAVQAWVIPTDEERQVARETVATIRTLGTQEEL
ncbi:MAG: acetate/propionate family kinase [Capsulimonadaceae bacterium]